jgi:hypothetical protein
MTNKTIRSFLLVALAACTAHDDGFYEDVPPEPALTTDEAAVLPDTTHAEHLADLEAALAVEVRQDDAALFDDDLVEGIVDVDVSDDVTIAAALLHAGLHPRASDAMRAAGVAAWRITQTVGSATASAGTHERDGYANGKAYSAATDISTSGMSQTQIKNLLERMAKLGFALWYRQQGRDGWFGSSHIHAVYANCAMKSSLRSQVRSWLAGRNGLVSNTIYQFHTFSPAAKAAVKAKFAMSNQGTSNGGAGISARVNTSGAPLTIRASASTNSAAVGSVADGAYITITCQKRAQSVTGTYGTTTLWDKVNGGYVSDAYVATGSDGQVAPTCP